jgi:Ni,Fe-hydrogenase III small subunit
MDVKFNKDEKAYNLLMKMVIQNIDCIFDAESVYPSNTLNEADSLEFMGQLTLENMSQIEKFFATSPKVVLEDKVTCKKCGFEHTIHTEDLLSFFI